MTAKADTNPLREALEPFAAYARNARSMPDNFVISAGSKMARRQLTIGDCRAAEAALASEPVAGTVFCPECDRAGIANCAHFDTCGNVMEAPPAPAGRQDLTRAMELAHEYDAGTAKCVASGYQEFGREFQRDRKILSDALRAYASPAPPQDGGEIETILNDRIAMLLAKNDRLFEMDCDTEYHRLRNTQEVEFLQDTLARLEDATPPAPGAADRAEQAAVDFCAWLRGYFAGSLGKDELSAFEANTIRNTLSMVPLSAPANAGETDRCPYPVISDHSASACIEAGHCGCDKGSSLPRADGGAK